MRGYSVMTIVVILTLLLAACGEVDTPSVEVDTPSVEVDTPSVDDIIAKSPTALETPIHGIIESTEEIPGQESQKYVIEIWQNGQEQTRTLVLEGPELMVGNITVRNGSDFWYYFASNQSYGRTEFDPASSSEQGAWEVGDIMQQMQQIGESRYLSSEKVANRDAHKLLFTPRDAFAASETTIWVDSESSYPLKMEREIEFGRSAMEFREIEYNPDLAADMFTFVPPEAAKELSSEAPEIEQVELTLEDVRIQAPFELMEPSTLPEGLEFESAQIFKMAEEQPDSPIGVMLNYVNESDDLIIDQINSTGTVESISKQSSNQYKQVMIRGHEGYWLETGTDESHLLWEENGILITILTTLSEEEVLAIAKSLQ